MKRSKSLLPWLWTWMPHWLTWEWVKTGRNCFFGYQILLEKKRHTKYQEQTFLLKQTKKITLLNKHNISKKQNDIPGHFAPNLLKYIWVFPWWPWWALSSWRKKIGLQTVGQVLESTDLGILKSARMGCRSASGGSPSPSSMAVIPRDHVSHLAS